MINELEDLYLRIKSVISVITYGFIMKNMMRSFALTVIYGWNLTVEIPSVDTAGTDRRDHYKLLLSRCLFLNL